ncbi:hypothetical protein MNBD_GAMMA07-983 [hydrothermal vent metagenome]|uniref:Uncharacterized protein n=1 Tax=hydrothermal vent metagenome TaxID=652676 RepID=A0A3B0X2U9_9ZZZZ
MKTRKHLYFVSALLISLSQSAAFAYDTLGDDLETPDTLLQTTTPDKHPSSAGDSNIVISSGGAARNEIDTPDPILSTVKSKQSSVSKDFKVESRKVTEDDKALESPDPLLKTAKAGYLSKKAEKQNALEMPDPLLDSMN